MEALYEMLELLNAAAHEPQERIAENMHQMLKGD